MPGRLTLLILLSGCLEAVEDPRPPPPPLEQDGSTFDPGRKPVNGSGYGSGSGSGSGSRDLPDAGPPSERGDATSDADPTDAQPTDAQPTDAQPTDA